jgi:hypothetical protein|tara:strand:+ start:7262 stop:7489 length:228 start_codon:yes stop_codon:yes gene_type:complete
MEVLSISAFVVGVTQIIKKTGMLPSNYIPAVATILGGVATYLSVYQVDMWANISLYLIGLTATGLVSFGKEIRKK